MSLISYIKKNINDYQMIYTEPNKLIRISDVNQLNKIAIEFIKSEIHSEETKCIVLTHHAPLFSDRSKRIFTADEKYINSMNNSAFHNNLINLIKSPIILWIYGHTHYRGKTNVNDVILWTNQLGYFREIEERFDPNEYIELNILE